MVGILDWTCKETDQGDIKTRKTGKSQAVCIPRVRLIGYTSAEKMGDQEQNHTNKVWKQNNIHTPTLRNIKDKKEFHENIYESEDNNIVRVGY